MTVAAITQRKTVFSGSGSNGPFTVTWPILAKSHIIVTKYDSSNNTTTLTEGTGTNQYSIELIAKGASGFSLTLVTNLDSGEKLVVEGSLPVSQPDNYKDQSDFYGERHEKSYDRQLMIVQEQLTKVARAIQIPAVDEVGTDMILPVAADRANKILIFSPDGTPTVSDEDYSQLDPSAVAASAAAAAQSETNAAGSATAAAASATDAANQAAALSGTSTTNTLIEVASKSFTTQSGKAFDVGRFVLIASDADEANYMHGQVTAYSGTSLTVNVTNIGGSGTFADWKITVAGTQGSKGDKGDTGAPGAGTGDMLGSNNLSDVVNAATAFANIKQTGTESATGALQLASSAITVTGTDTARAVHSAGVAAAIAAILGSRVIDVQFFTSSGTWTKPTGCNKALVFLTGGGGGAGGYQGNGGNGGTSLFGSHCTANGGSGGAHVNAGSGSNRTSTANGGLGASASGATFNIVGGDGMGGFVVTQQTSVTSYAMLGGNGGASFWGGGGRGASITGINNENGQNGSAYGSGGGGSGYTNLNAVGGGGGAGGTCIDFIETGLGTTETVTIGGGAGGGGSNGYRGGSGVAGCCMVIALS
jgi:hypothetical protein